MAASVEAINSTEWVIQVTEDSGTSYDTIAKCSSVEFSVNMDTREATTKDEGAWAKFLEGKKSWTASFENLVSFSTVSDYDKPNDIFTLAAARTEVGIRIGKLTTGDYVYTGDGYFNTFSISGGVEDNVTNSVGFQGTGALTQAAYS
jgi:predicted secreted protein